MSDNETKESSQNFEGKLNDFLEIIEKGFQMMPNILAEVSLMVLQPVIENI